MAGRFPFRGRRSGASCGDMIGLRRVGRRGCEEENEMESTELLAAAGLLTMSAGRIGAFVAAASGLAGIVVGVLAVTRPRSRVGVASGVRGAAVAVTAGTIGIALATVVMVTSDAGIGTGNGRGGAYLAAVLSVAALAVGAFALVRSRRGHRAD
ncbi:DUF6223 family protein [Stackebrandtia albiflava]|nr:DUF6223 family protein [Stackebrandtia albiflava]